MAPSMIKFYSKEEGVKNPRVIDCKNYLKEGSRIYPCFVLLRYQNWNDYGYFSKFMVFVAKSSDDVEKIGTVKIIQPTHKGKETILPREFTSLKQSEYLSRGSVPFYTELNRHSDQKGAVLKELHDVHKYGITNANKAKEIDSEFGHPYEVSLFREGPSNGYDNGVSAEYATYAKNFLKKMRASTIEPNTTDVHVLNLFFGGVFTTLESYLSDAFKYRVQNNATYFNRFIDRREWKDPQRFRNLAKIILNEQTLDPTTVSSSATQEGMEFLERCVEEELGKIIFHRFKEVQKLYKAILDIELSDGLSQFKEAKQKRHDIFHRNGRDQAGQEISTQMIDVLNLIDAVEGFIDSTERELSIRR